MLVRTRMPGALREAIHKAIHKAIRGLIGLGIVSISLLTVGCSKQADTVASDASSTHGGPVATQSAMPEDPKQREIAERFKQQSEMEAQRSKENAARAGQGKH